MTPEEAERFARLIEALDIRVAARPDILASPAGFVLGALIGAGRSDPTSAFVQIGGLADVLSYIVLYVRAQNGATLDPILDALVPMIPAAPGYEPGPG